MHVVLKSFPIGEQSLASGTIVDATSWRNLRPLVAQRYLRPATRAELRAHEAEHGKKANTP